MRSRAPASAAADRRAVVLGVTLLLMAAAALPARAGTFAPPDGCTGTMTVQQRGCRVSNHYVCAGDPAGHKWRADLDQEGVFFLSRTDAEAQWIESVDLPDGVVQTLDPAPEDPASFSTLLADGRDDYAFGLTKTDGTTSRVRGFDRLTGETAVIDGVPLEVTEFQFTETAPDGTVIRRGRGNEYIGRDMRMFFAGPGEADFGDGRWLPIDGRPVEFVFPGEPGFMATQPLFDCDAVMSMVAP